MNVLAIDPGPKESAFVFWDGKKVGRFDKVLNPELRELLRLVYLRSKTIAEVVIEEVASYGMPVGEDVFHTCFETGRFIQIMSGEAELIKRTKVKMNLCHSARAKDSNIITALVDRFGNREKHGKYSKGTKKNPGFFFGFSKDIWQAFALAVTFYDLKVG